MWMIENILKAISKDHIRFMYFTMNSFCVKIVSCDQIFKKWQVFPLSLSQLTIMKTA